MSLKGAKKLLPYFFSQSWKKLPTSFFCGSPSYLFLHIKKYIFIFGPNHLLPQHVAVQIIYFCAQSFGPPTPFKLDRHLHNIYSYFCHISLIIIIDNCIREHFIIINGCIGER